jgi:peptidoglycan/xylan/chitin deacetylase (PgdA/CDA1 family)
MLVALGLPATYFLTTDPLREDAALPPPEYWWDALDHMVEDLTGQTVGVRIGRRQHVLELSTEAGRAAGTKTLNRALVRQHPASVQACLAQLRSAGAKDRSCALHRRMSTEQVVALAALPGVDIGSHTCSHAALGQLSAAEAEAELRASRVALADVLGAPPRAIAYPYGAPGTLRRRIRAPPPAPGTPPATSTSRGRWKGHHRTWSPGSLSVPSRLRRCCAG